MNHIHIPNILNLYEISIEQINKNKDFFHNQQKHLVSNETKSFDFH